MKSISKSDLARLRILADLAYSNPFSTERIELEKKALGKAFVADEGIAWSRNFRAEHPDNPEEAARPNVQKIGAIASELVQRFCHHANRGETFDAQTWADYWDVVTYVLVYRHLVQHYPDDFSNKTTVAKVYDAFAKDYQNLIAAPGIEQTTIQSSEHLFACLCQVHRAFYKIYFFILGDSLPSVELRRSVWESVFTCDMRRYQRTLFNRMNSIPTLITGPSGTGKELVARAIGLSLYLPFDPVKKCFAKAINNCFFPLNLSAMSETLVESELFGHRKGAFTGAVSHRDGWLASCSQHGAIFLDEIGELAPSLQVKLLRVVQQRTYSPLGSTEEHRFDGKIIGATNRDMDAEIQQGNFRADLYFRLCADRIETPSLRDQLRDRPEDLRSLVYFVSRRFIGDDSADADGLTDQAVHWIEHHLGEDYPWSGNIRELEQCVSGVMIRGCYVATNSKSPEPVLPRWVAMAVKGNLNADQLLQHYCNWIYLQKGSYEAAAKHLGIDRRTVKAKIERTKTE